MLFDKKCDIVTEAYIGKTTTLKQAEIELVKVLEIIYTFDQPTLETGKIVNYSSCCRKFNELLSKEFGTRILVNFTPKPIFSIGGYTFITSTLWDFAQVNKNFKATGKLVSDMRAFPIYVNISYALINEQKIDSEELMGIILHEIGHNIQHVPIITSLNIVSALFSPFTSTIFSNIERTMSIVEGLPVLNQVIRFENIFTKIVKDITGGGRYDALKTFYKLMIIKSHQIITIFDPMRHFGTYAAERYSDSFATAYGYGQALSRGLLKIDPVTANTTYNKVVNSNAITAFGDLALVTFMNICMMVAMTGVHPVTGHRIKNGLEKLERDLRTGDYPIEVKKSLESDIKAMRTIYTDYLNASDAQKNEIKSFYRKYIERYGINPVRNLALDNLYEELEI